MISQSHFTVSFPLMSPTDAQVVAEHLPSFMPRLFRAADTIGTIHYSRFTVLSEKTLLFLGDFDGELDELMGKLAKLAGSVFDFVFQHVNDPPPAPVVDHADAFAEWRSMRNGSVSMPCRVRKALNGAMEAPRSRSSVTRALMI